MNDTPYTQNDLSFDRVRKLQTERDHAAADMAHRDDLARDVAREWTPGAMMADAARGVLRQDYPKLIAALDRLAAAYGETP